MCSQLDPHEKIALLERVAEIFISDPAEHIELFEDGTAKGVKLDSLKIDIQSINVKEIIARASPLTPNLNFSRSPSKTPRSDKTQAESPFSFKEREVSTTADSLNFRNPSETHTDSSEEEIGFADSQV